MMKKTFIALLTVASFSGIAQAAEMIGPYPAVGQTNCGGLKVLSTAINSDNMMALKITDPSNNLTQTYVAKRTADMSDDVVYTLSRYDQASGTFTPDPAHITIRFGIKMQSGQPGTDRYNMTIGNQQFVCSPFTIFS
ncbi:hypothetical protein I6G97_01625 [Edwardsiella hoshinae]|nr:hypothetical protein I6G97_01625 [Edwardsiella hoshinae]